MKEIPLTRGHVAIVDDEDHRALSQFKWCATSAKSRTKIYACRQVYDQNGKQTTVLMHAVLCPAPVGFEPDHVDGNGLNNQRANLRLSTKSQNAMNTGPHRNNRSGFKGVSWNANSQKWQVHIRAGARRLYLGLYTDKAEAAAAYDEKARELHGQFARSNYDRRA